MFSLNLVSYEDFARIFPGAVLLDHCPGQYFINKVSIKIIYCKKIYYVNQKYTIIQKWHHRNFVAYKNKIKTILENKLYLDNCLTTDYRQRSPDIMHNL